jgi:hypothetical protein
MQKGRSFMEGKRFFGFIYTIVIVALIIFGIKSCGSYLYKESKKPSATDRERYYKLADLEIDNEFEGRLDSLSQEIEKAGGYEKDRLKLELKSVEKFKEDKRKWTYKDIDDGNYKPDYLSVMRKIK